MKMLPLLVRSMQKRYDWFTIFAVIALLLIPVHYLAPEAFFFKQFAGEFSVYGITVSLVLLLGFLGWIGFFRRRMKREVSKKQFSKQLRDILAPLGFRRSWLQVAAGLILGVCLGVFTWHVGGTSSSNSPGLTGWVVSMGIIMVFFAPLLEETLFRGYFINRCISSGRGKAWAWALAVAASIFLFSWLHASSPGLKVVPGAVFTLVYLWGRGNNMTAAVMTHATGNAMILLSAFLPLGTIESVAALGTVIISISLLTFILWMVSQPNKIPRRKIPTRKTNAELKQLATSFLLLIWPIVFLLLWQFPAHSIKLAILLPLASALLLFILLGIIRLHLNSRRWKNLPHRIAPLTYELFFSFLAFFVAFAFIHEPSSIIVSIPLIIALIFLIFIVARRYPVSWRYIILGSVSGAASFFLITLVAPYFFPSGSVLIGVAAPLSIILPLSILALLNFISRARTAPVLALLILIASTSPYIIPNSYTTFYGEGKVRDIAKEIASGKSDNESIVRGIMDWQRKNMTNSYGVEVKNFLGLNISSDPPYVLKESGTAAEIIFYKYGACAQYSILFAALARIENIDTRIVHNPGEDHVWAEVRLDNNWVHVDPSNNIFNDSGVYERSKQLSYVYAEYENGDIENITDRYTGTGRLVVHVFKNGEPAKNAEVVVKSRFLMENVGGMYKEPREVMLSGHETDGNGLCVFNLGGNNYNVIAISELDGSRDEKIVSVRENGETQVDLFLS